MSTPYIGFDNQTLNKLPEVREGDLIDCDECGGKHPIKYGTGSDGKKSELLGFYTCGSHSFLASIDGKLITGTKADISGRI